MTNEIRIDGEDGDGVEMLIASLPEGHAVKVDARDVFLPPVKAREVAFAMLLLADACEAADRAIKAVMTYDPDRVSHPGSTLADVLDERGITQAHLAERMKRPKKTINEIIKGKSAITPTTAAELESVLGIPATFWLMRQHHYDAKAQRGTP